MRVRLSNSTCESACVSIHTCCVLCLQINPVLVSLLSIFVGILFSKAEGPGPLSLTTGLAAKIWCSHHHDLASVSSWEPKSRSKPLQAEVTGDHFKVDI